MIFVSRPISRQLYGAESAKIGLILILDKNISSRIPCATHTRIVRMHDAPSHAESDAPLAL